MKKRRRFKQTQTLGVRLAEEVQSLRQQAELLEPGTARDELIDRAQRAEAAGLMNDWLGGA